MPRKKKPKYAHRHVQFAVSERDLLKEEAWGKPPELIRHEDFQAWVSPFLWDKVRGISVLDRNGNNLSEEDRYNFLKEIHRWA